MNRNERIAVGVGLVVVGILLIGIVNTISVTPASNDLAVQESERTMQTQGLIIEDVVVGEGGEAVAGKLVTAHYVGTLPDGTKFDSSRDRGTPFQFVLGVGYVIKGWDLGIEGMKVGGTRKLVVSPELGYGSRAIGAIPPNSTLHFEVELLDVADLPAEQ